VGRRAQKKEIPLSLVGACGRENIIKRYMAGDESLKDEIDANAQSSSPLARMARASLQGDGEEERDRKRLRLTEDAQYKSLDVPTRSMILQQMYTAGDSLKAWHREGAHIRGISQRQYPADESLKDEIDANAQSSSPVAQIARASVQVDGEEELDRKRRSLMEDAQYRSLALGNISTAVDLMGRLNPAWRNDGRLLLQLEDQVKNIVVLPSSTLAITEEYRQLKLKAKAQGSDCFVDIWDGIKCPGLPL